MMFQPPDGSTKTAFWLNTNPIFAQEKQAEEESIKSVTESIFDDLGGQREYPVERPSGTYTVFTCSSV